jgi:hypothetical protein
MDQLLAGVADDWRTSRNIGERLAKARAAGASWRFIAYRTGIPTTTVRRWAAPFLGHEPATGSAATRGARTHHNQPRVATAGAALGGRAISPRAPAEQRAARASDAAVAPRPGGHSAKNARRAGIPNNL